MQAAAKRRFSYRRIAGVVRQSAFCDGLGHAFDGCCGTLSDLSHEKAQGCLRDLLASPRFRFVGGMRVMARTFLVKTANSVAMVAERCVMMVALK